MKIPNGALGVPGTGIESVKEYLEGLGAVPLSATELASINKVRFIAGWKLGVDFGGGQEHMLAMVLPEGFPYEAPRVAVLDAPPILTWPHLEEGKLLCVLPATTAVDPELPTAQIGELLNEAIRLVQSILSGRLDDDFDREFTAYWRRGAATDAQEFVSLLEPSGVHREIQIWRGKSFHVVAETADDLRNWMYKRFGREKAAGMVFAKSLCLVAKAAIRPTDYPRSAADLRRLFVGDHRALELMAAQALGDDDRDIVIAVPTPTGMGFAAVSIAPGGQPSPGGKRVDEFWKGFRKGRMPPNVALQRATSPARKVTRHKVDRVDHSWIHGRDHDSRQVVLKDANVLLVGCGSLGSSVAELLARAGVGNLTLMDGEVLDWANISRHSLGAENVGNPKASALKNRLATAFPHLPQIEAIDRPLTPGYDYRQPDRRCDQ